MKKIFLIMALSLSFFLSFGCTNVEKKEKTLDAEFGFSQEDFTVVEEYDTHAWMGDGRYYLTLDCSNNVDKANEVVKDWQKLPFTEDIKLIMYGDVQHGSFYERKDSNTKFPEIENGSYMVVNRHNGGEAEQVDDLPYMSSNNFTIAVYDSDTNKMYYFEYDS